MRPSIGDNIRLSYYTAPWNGSEDEHLVVFEITGKMSFTDTARQESYMNRLGKLQKLINEVRILTTY